MEKQDVLLKDVVIKFAGDSGDGMQLTGAQFTNNTALLGIDLATFPDYPAEIRAPQGTLPGVSGYQIHFSSDKVYTPGDTSDVLVAMNAAALKVNLKTLKMGGIIIVNSDGFDTKNLRLANYTVNPLEDQSLSNFIVYKIDVTKHTREALADFTEMGVKERDRAKNMFVLGLIYWLYNRDIETTISFLKDKFGKKEQILQSNIKVLKAGYYFGETAELFTSRYKVDRAQMPKGIYRNIMGNQSLALGLVAAAKKSNLTLFLGSYPITPASDILHELSKYQNFNVKTFQAEDEIAAVCSAIGASYGGNIGVTTSSGPGIALKAEAIGLAVMLELPLIIINIQRGGPSTGLPTKTEQSDLLQAYYGRNGECPLPVLACSSPADCFTMAYEAVKMSIQHMVPVILLSDGYIANGSEPWCFPQEQDIPEIKYEFKRTLNADEETFLPYKRNEDLVRAWTIPGTPNLEHRIGGLEKQYDTGAVSYDAENHQKMVKVRQAKVDRIAEYIPLQTIESGNDTGEVLVIGWGSTYGTIKSAVNTLIDEGKSISFTHLKYLRPFPKNLGELLKRFNHIIIPEINNGQLIKIIREQFLVDAKGYNKIMGTPISKEELIGHLRTFF